MTISHEDILRHALVGYEAQLAEKHSQIAYVRTLLRRAELGQSAPSSIGQRKPSRAQKARWAAYLEAAQWLAKPCK